MDGFGAVKPPAAGREATTAPGTTGRIAYCDDCMSDRAPATHESDERRCPSGALLGLIPGPAALARRAAGDARRSPDARGTASAAAPNDGSGVRSGWPMRRGDRCAVGAGAAARNSVAKA